MFAVHPCLYIFNFFFNLALIYYFAMKEFSFYAFYPAVSQLLCLDNGGPVAANCTCVVSQLFSQLAESSEVMQTSQLAFPPTCSPPLQIDQSSAESCHQTDRVARLRRGTQALCAFSVPHCKVLR